MVLFVGQHFEYKGYKKILISAKSVWEKYPEAHFVFIGPKYKTANKHFKLFKDEKRILSLDLVSLEEKTNALASCDIFCLPSTQESFGGAYTEAWSFKKPVIGCNIPAVSEVIDDCKNGLLINQESMEISSSIIELLDNFELSTILGEAGYKKVNEKYSWDKLVSLTEDGYRKLIN